MSGQHCTTSGVAVEYNMLILLAMHGQAYNVRLRASSYVIMSAWWSYWHTTGITLRHTGMFTLLQVGHCCWVVSVAIAMRAPGAV